VTDAPSLSVVVASHGRPRALRRCLVGLSQSAIPRLEVIVAADAEGLAALSDLPFAGRLKTVMQDPPNLSEARNAGIARAAGDLVSFVDDDAVPEPSWAAAMVAAFAARPDLAAATGPVLGRNGISLQWGPMAADALGRDRPLGPGEEPGPGLFHKLHGTNMIFRSEVLRDLGGFDPAFRFYLDDTDLALRVAGAGLPTAWVPGAVVHHAFAASARRDADRVPLDLRDVGASAAIFLRKHAGAGMEEALYRLGQDQYDRLFRLVRRRKLSLREMRALLEGLREGIDEGRARTPGATSLMRLETAYSSLFDAPCTKEEVLSGWRHRGGALRAEAARLTAEGARVSLFLFEPTPRAHRVAFTDGGWWEQTGGLYGRSDRAAPRLQAWRFGSRVSAELRRTDAIRFVYKPNAQFHGRK
jgi:O-antigen biosynthesis protein